MTILADVKTAIRVSTTALDTEIDDIIDACKADLILSGLLAAKVVDTDPLIKRAIIIYAKSQFGIDNKDSEKYWNSYESLKRHLCLSIEYTVEATV